MNTGTEPAPSVKPARLPFRPLLAPPVVTHWTDEVGAVHVLLSARRKADAYEVIPISTDLGGAAFRWFKRGGESYDVLANGRDSSCTCCGWGFTSGCKHLHATFALLESGVLRVAPDSAAGHADDGPDDAAYRFCVEADAWRRLCGELKIDPETLLRDLPCYDTLRRTEEAARLLTCTAEEANDYLRRLGSEDAEAPTVEEAARAMRKFIDQRVEWWG